MSQSVPVFEAEEACRQGKYVVNSTNHCPKVIILPVEHLIQRVLWSFGLEPQVAHHAIFGDESQAICRESRLDKRIYPAALRTSVK
jgi:hypothetical protein